MSPGALGREGTLLEKDSRKPDQPVRRQPAPDDEQDQPHPQSSTGTTELPGCEGKDTRGRGMRRPARANVAGPVTPRLSRVGSDRHALIVGPFSTNASSFGSRSWSPSTGGGRPSLPRTDPRPRPDPPFRSGNDRQAEGVVRSRLVIRSWSSLLAGTSRLVHVQPDRH
jgi:hypothetical protein